MLLLHVYVWFFEAFTSYFCSAIAFSFLSRVPRFDVTSVTLSSSFRRRISLSCQVLFCGIASYISTSSNYIMSPPILRRRILFFIQCFSLCDIVSYFVTSILTCFVDNCVSTYILLYNNDWWWWTVFSSKQNAHNRVPRTLQLMTSLKENDQLKRK